MNDKPAGGYAFPWCGDLNQTPTIGLGMTLRDYFAAKALSGLMANDAFIARCREDGIRENVGFDALVATGAYLIADAMLRERVQ